MPPDKGRVAISPKGLITPHMVRHFHRTYALAVRALALVLALILALPSPISITPAQASVFNFGVKDEKELGEKFNIMVRSQLTMVDDAEVVDYVRDLVARLDRVTPPHPFPFSVSVVKDNSINAFAAPAGYMFVFTGLLLNMEHECEVAGVMAHEMSHVIQRHIAKRVEQGAMMSIASLAGILAGLVLGSVSHQSNTAMAVMAGSSAAATQAMLNYSRDDEREADEVGMNFLSAAGFPPRGLPQAMDILNRMRIFQGSGSIPTYLSTHPYIAERVSYLTERVKRLPKEVQNRPDHDERFLRVQMILRSRYGVPETAIAYYQKKGHSMTKLDRLGLAVARGRTNDIPGARQAFDQALAENGDDSLWLREAGRFYLKTRNFDRAKSFLKRAVDKNPNDMVAMYELAGMLAQERDYAQAMSLMSRVAQRSPEAPEIYSQYGRISGEAGDIFHAYLYLSYAALYSNNQRQIRFQMEKARNAARTEAQHREYDRLERLYRERAEYWPHGGAM
jgi:predicted Zn-dependent protease